MYRRAVGAFAVSDEVEQLLRTKGYRGPIRQLHHSYDPTLFRARPDSEKQQIRDEFRIPRDAVVIGYFGRLTLEKGLIDLAKALQLLAQEGRPSRVVFLLRRQWPGREGDQTSFGFTASGTLPNAPRGQPRPGGKLAFGCGRARAPFAHDTPLERAVWARIGRSDGSAAPAVSARTPVSSRTWSARGWAAAWSSAKETCASLPTA